MRKSAPTLTCEPVRAAQYVRRSTDLQQYSIENQKAAIQEYAQQRVRKKETPLECGYVALLGRLNRGNADFHSFYMFRCVDKLNPCTLRESDPWWGNENDPIAARALLQIRQCNNLCPEN